MSIGFLSLLLALALSCGNSHGMVLPPDDNYDYAWENSGYFEGDIMLREGDGARNGLLDPSHYWPNATLVYKIRTHDFDEDQLKALEEAFRTYEAETCVHLRKATKHDKAYALITGEDTGCHSHVGYTGGEQQVNLHPNKPGHGCFRPGTILHELLHAFGFHHQQSATNRDDYVTIIWNNIEKGHEKNFNKYPASLITDFGVEYDYSSIMHYGKASFSVNGEATIVPKDPNAEIGQRLGFSAKDIKKLERMYGCRK